MNLRILTIAGVVAFLSACNQSSQPQFEMPSSPIDQSTAVLQALPPAPWLRHSLWGLPDG